MPLNASIAALKNGSLASAPPKLALITSAPFCSANSILLIMSSKIKFVAPALIAIIFAFGATPITPLLLSFTVAMVPATCVPWDEAVGRGVLSLSK